MKPNAKLLLILGLGLLLRTILLDKYPTGFTPDEAAFGYNSYSLLKTGRDEWGTPWWQLPFTSLRSFGDYKLPLYAFLTIPSVAILGLTETATRLPNALVGTAAIFAVYLLAKKLFDQRCGLWAAALMSISPWSIQLSRGAFEANLATLLLPLAVYFLLSARWALSAAALILSFYAYHSTRLLIFPLLFLAPKSRKFWILLLVGILPGLLGMLIGPAAKRATDVSIFSPTGGWSAVADLRFTARNSGLPDGIARLFHNKVTYSVPLFINNILQYISPQFLVTSGPAEGTYGMLPGTGAIYLIELVFLGIYLSRHTKSKLTWLILLGIIPAALAKGPGYAANRAAGMLPFLIIAIAAGLPKAKKLLIPLYLISFLFFVQKYYYHSPYILARPMLFGMKEAISRSLNLAPNYSQVRFSRGLSESHIYVAFYSKYDPTAYQQATADWPQNVKFLDQFDGYYLGTYRFGDLHYTDHLSGSTLFVGRPSDFPENTPEHFHIDYPDSTTAIKVSAKTP